MRHRVVTIPQACNAGAHKRSTRARARAQMQPTQLWLSENGRVKKKRSGKGRGRGKEGGHAEVGVKREGVLHEIFVVACAVA